MFSLFSCLWFFYFLFVCFFLGITVLLISFPYFFSFFPYHHHPFPLFSFLLFFDFLLFPYSCFSSSSCSSSPVSLFPLSSPSVSYFHLYHHFPALQPLFRLSLSFLPSPHLHYLFLITLFFLIFPLFFLLSFPHRYHHVSSLLLRV